MSIKTDGVTWSHPVSSGHYRKVGETVLGEIADLGSGGTPKSTEPNYYNGDIPWLINNSVCLHRSALLFESIALISAL